MAHHAYSYRDNPNIPDFDDSQPIIVFDGHCALCSNWVQFILRRDPHKRFNFLLAQSPLGEAIYGHYRLKPKDYETNLLIENGHIRAKSDGSLAMFQILGWPWKVAALFRIIPTALRDMIYDLIARNRIKWFGARQSCYLPHDDVKTRFL